MSATTARTTAPVTLVLAALAAVALLALHYLGAATTGHATLDAVPTPQTVTRTITAADCHQCAGATETWSVNGTYSKETRWDDGSTTNEAWLPDHQYVRVLTGPDGEQQQTVATWGDQPATQLVAQR